MTVQKHILGIDIGSVAAGLVVISLEKQIIKSDYRFHGGDIAKTVEKMLEGIELSKIAAVGATSSTPDIFRTAFRYDDQVAIISAAHELHPDAGAILSVGGEKFGLILFDEAGNYRKYLSNTSCAAGTGSFLDQQAGRLNLNGIEDLCARARKNTGDIPKIASRCAVFAKTDLIHAQQEGYSLESICDGLCHGLARNIVDTLFSNERPLSPMVFCGGVSYNRAVAGHINALTGVEIVIDKWSHLYGAYGAAVCLAGGISAGQPARFQSPEDIICVPRNEQAYAYPPLELSLSRYPDLNAHEQYVFIPDNDTSRCAVEVDAYLDGDTGNVWEAYIGLDIGSTSTKAVLIDDSDRVLAGFYTRTAGRPVDAMQSILAAVEDFSRRKGISISIRGAGTTGSGRNFVGRILGTDLILDEITAHARAAVELDPSVDTIIEIGGQDAKFTTLKNGRVTFSAMNTVCAAGTGSFIEEQAKRLQCPLAEFPVRTRGCKSPMTSDRCTVFMERDINHFLNAGYSRDEMLAASLHAVRENYLTKVAIEGQIGKTVFFQGATAKNRALVAAFEQRLERPIRVSRYCHLTGALGAALALTETIPNRDSFVSRFRGLSLCRQQIPIRNEVCDLCANHCKITCATVGEETVAFGFLCGRDYETRRFVRNNTSGFDLATARRQAQLDKTNKTPTRKISIGIPAALHLVDDLPFWTHFFGLLGIRTIVSDRFREGVKMGKHLTGAEFCAPMTALHGHVDYLLKEADYVFLPQYFENRDKEKHTRRQFCYYTQYAPALIAGRPDASRVLMPLVNYLYSHFHSKVQLYKMLKSIYPDTPWYMEVSAAYDSAVEHRRKTRLKLVDTYRNMPKPTDDIHVVLMGRPYTSLTKEMNKNIPDIFAALGIKVFFQDMLDPKTADLETIRPLLDEIHWEHASAILKAAVIAAQTESLYPVLLTNFMCTPDSFVMDYFRKIMDLHDKPYLILQLDEHGSSVGYETRIEAAVRSFRNHNDGVAPPVPRASCRALHPAHAGNLDGKTILMPNWDDVTCRLLVANLQREGFDARLLEETESSVRKSLRHNTGQCIPLNIIAQEFADYVERYNLDPAQAVLWMASGEIACNLKLYPYHMKRLVNTFGNGMEKASVYNGNITMSDISHRVSLNAYFAFMFGGMLRKMTCRVRPYECETGATDLALTEGVRIFTEAFLGLRDKDEAARSVTALFEAIDIRRENRPQVAIFGDLYVRDNQFINQNLIRFIEDNGGEVITTPYSTYARMIAGPYFRKWFREGKYWHAFSSKTLLSAVQWMERRYYRHFERVLLEPEHDYTDAPDKILAGYHMGLEHTGESMDNVLKIHYIKKHYPNLALFVQTNPAFCCPSIVTQAMSLTIEQKTGIPVVSITYDGTGSFKNSKIIPYLAYPRKAGRGSRVEMAAAAGGIPG